MNDESNVVLCNGDIFDSSASWDIMCHQVNCKGGFGRGIAETIAAKYPHIKDFYTQFVKFYTTDPYHTGNNENIESSVLLGKVQILQIFDTKFDEKPNRFIANLFGQDDYGADPNKLYTNYEALRVSLDRLSGVLSGLSGDPHKKLTIAFPYKMSCGLDNGDWNIVLGMINEFAKSSPYIEKVKIFKLGG